MAAQRVISTRGGDKKGTEQLLIKRGIVRKTNNLERNWPDTVR